MSKDKRRATKETKPAEKKATKAPRRDRLEVDTKGTEIKAGGGFGGILSGWH